MAARKPVKKTKTKTVSRKPEAPRRNHALNHPTELIVALDYPRADRALEMVETLQGLPLIYKVGFELFLAGGPELVRELIHRKSRVFLDLKFHDIPNTVAKAARQAALLSVDMFSLHLAGGSAMIRAVAEELSDIPELKPKVLGVTVLTSFDDLRWSEVTKALTGHALGIQESVDGLVEHAPAWGVDGLICSPLELASIRRRYPSIYTVVPGIRPEGSAAGDQARVMTPAEAHAAGASAVVVGRPITQADEPRAVVESVLRDLSPVRRTA